LEDVERDVLREVGYMDAKWIEPTEDRVQWWALVAAVWELWIILPQRWLVG